MKNKKKKYTLQQLRDLYEDFKPEAVLDFHDYGIVNNEMIAHIYDQFINESISFGQVKVLIITGKGDVVRPFVKRKLDKDKRVNNFQNAGYFQGGGGAFEVTLINK